MKMTNKGVTETTQNDTVLYTLVVSNNAGYELPSTGGPGTHLIYLFGLLFTAIASTGLLMKKRRAA